MRHVSRISWCVTRFLACFPPPPLRPTDPDCIKILLACFKILGMFQDAAEGVDLNCCFWSILANPTSLILAAYSRFSSTLLVFRSASCSESGTNLMLYAVYDICCSALTTTAFAEGDS